MENIEITHKDTENEPRYKAMWNHVADGAGSSPLASMDTGAVAILTATVVTLTLPFVEKPLPADDLVLLAGFMAGLMAHSVGSHIARNFSDSRMHIKDDVPAKTAKPLYQIGATFLIAASLATAIATGYGADYLLASESAQPAQTAVPHVIPAGLASHIPS